MLLIAVLVWAPGMIRGVTPAGAMSDPGGAGCGGNGHALAAPPAISISIEPAALAPYAEAESPVVFPGYLLPDDGCEEPAHAGS
jgi:hypothetical protein